MIICGVCGISKALCGHPDWGWASGPLRGAVLRFLFGFLLGEVGDILPQLQDPSWAGLASNRGAVFVQIMPEVEWVWEVVIPILMVFLL